MLGGLIALATISYFHDPNAHPFPAFHLFSGGAMLGAFFIATDPVSASTTPTGRLIYGAGIGGQMIAKEIERNLDLGLKLVGLIDDNPRKHRRKIIRKQQK